MNQLQTDTNLPDATEAEYFFFIGHLRAVHPISDNFTSLAQSRDCTTCQRANQTHDSRSRLYTRIWGCFKTNERRRVLRSFEYQSQQICEKKVK